MAVSIPRNSWLTQATFVVVLLCLLLPDMQAMTPGPTIIRQCPECPQLLREFTIGSGNTIGAVLWTDGKIKAPMLGDRPPIVKCPKCKATLWIDETKEVGRLGDFRSTDEPRKEWETAIDAAPATEADLLKLSHSPSLTKEQKITVCRRAWWLANDAVRHSRGTLQRKLSKEQMENMKLLSSLLDEKDPRSRLTKAEIARELGQFGTCARLLAGPFEKSEHNECAEFIRALAREKNAIVRPFPDLPPRRK